MWLTTLLFCNLGWCETVDWHEQSDALNLAIINCFQIYGFVFVLSFSFFNVFLIYTTPSFVQASHLSEVNVSPKWREG